MPATNNMQPKWKKGEKKPYTSKQREEYDRRNDIFKKRETFCHALSSPNLIDFTPVTVYLVRNADAFFLL